MKGLGISQSSALRSAQSQCQKGERVWVALVGVEDIDVEDDGAVDWEEALLLKELLLNEDTRGWTGSEGCAGSCTDTSLAEPAPLADETLPGVPAFFMGFLACAFCPCCSFPGPNWRT